MENEIEIAELTTKLGGIILKKAELEKDFEKVYLSVFEKMITIENISEDNILQILGEMGG